MRIGDFDETRLATDELQSLKTLTRYQQSLKQEVATVKTQAICLMDAYFPEYAGMFTDMFGTSSMAILSKCPTPAECNRTHAATLAKSPLRGLAWQVRDREGRQRQGGRQGLGRHHAGV